jgi:hypothetical protein
LSTPTTSTYCIRWQVELFQSGTQNPDRMVITHSPTYNDWGLMYRDMDAGFHFLGGGTTVLRIALASALDARLDILGGNWDTVFTEGDLRIGDATYRLKIGIATGGTGAGHATIAAQGASTRSLWAQAQLSPRNAPLPS